jgi:hypothetical protein
VLSGGQDGPIVSCHGLSALEADGPIAEGEYRSAGLVEGDRRYVGVEGLLHGPN